MKAITSYETAIKYFKQVQHDKDNVSDHIYNCHYNMSMVYYENQMFSDAIMEAENCIKINDTSFKVC